MTDIFSMGGMDVERSNREAQLSSSDDVPVDFFDGFDVTGSWGKGSATLARGVAMAGAVAPIAYDYLFNDDTEAQDWYFKNVVDDPYDSAQNYYKPDGVVVGTGGAVLNSVVEMLPQFVGGGSSLVASTQLNTAIDLVNEGVDAVTAQGVGTAMGIGTGIGVWLPVIGKSGLQKVLGAAVLNPLVNAISRGVSSEILESGGYEKQAEQFDPFNLQTIATDAIMGAVFGGVDVMARGADAPTDWNVIPQKAKDAVASAKAYINRTHETAPGNPVDIKAQNAHLDAVDTAVTQVIEGKKVEVADKVASVEFAPRTKPDVVTDKLDIDDAVGVPYQAELFDVPEVKRAEVPDDVIMSMDVQSADPEISMARQAIEKHGDYEIEISRGDDGQPVKVKASELIAEIENTYKADIEIGKALTAATNCFIGGL